MDQTRCQKHILAPLEGMVEHVSPGGQSEFEEQPVTAHTGVPLPTSVAHLATERCPLGTAGHDPVLQGMVQKLEQPHPALQSEADWQRV
jgi:hypothetical protein